MTPIAAASLAVAAMLPATAAAEEPADHFQSAIGGRYRIIAIEQPDRDLASGSALINVLFDASTGRSWVLRFDVDPATKRNAYVWVEIPLVGGTR
jgi:hypothetical protein